jgi:hypothetical protein
MSETTRTFTQQIDLDGQAWTASVEDGRLWFRNATTGEAVSTVEVPRWWPGADYRAGDLSAERITDLSATLKMLRPHRP